MRSIHRRRPSGVVAAEEVAPGVEPAFFEGLAEDRGTVPITKHLVARDALRRNQGPVAEPAPQFHLDLGAMALGRAWFGVVLVTAYGLGMAATLTGAGILLLRARGVLDRGRGRLGGLARVASALPVATSSVIVAVGVALAARGAVAI